MAEKHHITKNKRARAYIASLCPNNESLTPSLASTTASIVAKRPLGSIQTQRIRIPVSCRRETELMVNCSLKLGLYTYVVESNTLLVSFPDMQLLSRLDPGKPP